VVAFLRQLLRLLPGKLLVLWDGASIHRNQDVRDFLAAGAARRLHLEHVPAYAPDLNPDEGIWQHLKRVELRNRCCQDLQELRWEFRLAVRRLRRTPDVIRACFRKCGFAV
jgi:transposase